MAEENNSLHFGEEFDKADFGLIDAGKYEVSIDKIEPRVSAKSGKKYLNFTFKIRGDVDQAFKNRKLFWSVFQKDNDPCYDFGRINKLILTQKGAAGYRDRFTDFDEVLLYLNGIHLALTVEVNFDDYRNEDRNNIKEWSFEPSEWDKADHAAPVVSPSAEVAFGDVDKTDDLPF